MRRTAAQMAKLQMDALELRRAGIPVAKIRDQLEFPSLAATEAAIAKARAATAPLTDPNDVRLLELDRLDRLHAGVWAKAVKGDVAAIDRVIRLSELRMKLAGTPGDKMVMRDAFDKTIAALRLPDTDAAAVAAGRRVAEQIDSATATGDPLQVTKALYLIPHLMNVLKDLGATPAARDAMDTVARDATGAAPVDDLTDFKSKRGIS